MNRTRNNFRHHSPISMMAAQILDAVILETSARQVPAAIKHPRDRAETTATGTAPSPRQRVHWSVAPGPLASELWS